MADRQQPSRRGSSSGRQPSSQKQEKQSASRRTDVIRCENCGEDYSITYKRCPFCDERPGRTGVGGRRVAGGSAVHPIQVVWLVISLVIIIAALFIVFKLVSPLFSAKPGGSSSSTGTSQSGAQSTPGGGSQSTPDGSGASGSTGDVSQPVDPVVTVTSIKLDREDVTLTPNEDFQFTATLTPAGVTTPITWSSSDTSLLTVDEYGNVKNVNSGSTLANVTITATCGGQTATCIVRCRPSGGSAGTGDGQTGGSTGTTTTLQPNSEAVITGAGSGLNIRSGPGTTYEKQASTQNGAVVTVLEAAENGWYKIRYNTGGGSTAEGYVLGDYLAPR